MTQDGVRVPALGKSEPAAERAISWEVGDSKQQEFYPQFKTMHWDNAANFSLRLVADDYAGAVVRTVGSTTEWEKGAQTARFYPLDDVHGGFEIEVEFAERPDSNVVAYSISTKALEFFYQDELDEEARKRGDVRPENVVGSYAVYSALDHGKAFHIYRPSARDAKGRTVWCDLHIDEGAQLLTVTVPQEFLDEAAYPVIVDPTLGYSTIGGTSGGYANAQIEFHGPWSPASSGTLTDIQFYGSAVGPKVTYGVYADSAGTPGSLLYTSAEATISSSAAWNTAAITGSITSGTSYWLAYRVNGSGTIQYDSGTPSGKFNTASTYVSGVMPSSPPSLTNFSNVKRSLYANYTAGGGGGLFVNPLSGRGGAAAQPLRLQ